MCRKLSFVLFLAALMIAGAAFAASPEAQGPMTPAVQPAAAPAGQPATQPSPLKLQPDKRFVTTTCTFITNDCFYCPSHTQLQDCDEYSCYDDTTGQTSTVLTNCTGCHNYC